MIDFTVVCADVADVQADLLILKYAQEFFGADEAVAKSLRDHGISLPDLMPAPWDYFMTETRGCIAPDRVMFLGTSPFDEFDYTTIDQFAHRAARILIDKGLPIRHVTTTNHGIGLGLDPFEALQRLITGIMVAAYEKGLGMLERVSIVERDPRRSKLLDKYLAENQAQWLTTISEMTLASKSTLSLTEQTAASTPKGHVFVAMPFSDEFEDIYEFGIYPSVRQHDYACEHVGQAAFTGDVLERIRVRIETAEFMIADLTDGRPNVYLEVGYAWGRNVPTIIIAHEGEELHFDVSRHRCIFYRNIRHLAKELTTLIAQLSR